MKRSNILFIVLLVTLFVLPGIILGGFYLRFDKRYLFRFDIVCSVVMIENPALGIEDVEIDTSRYSSFPGSDRSSTDLPDVESYIYYEGARSYLPLLRLSNDTLYIGKPEKEVTERLSLKMRFVTPREVYLNGTFISILGE
ncbi:MAG: hypothetical protein LBL58_05830 [Tannerellaceae bacterium]|jgi:hypothetical protein|nr:hypothetical protein [Tannerellaceae bacterium]